MPLPGDSAELATALHCVSTQWERGDRQAAVASLADAVLIAEGEGRADRAASLARGVARLALAARNSGSGERPAVRVDALPPAAALEPRRKVTVSGERPAITTKLGDPATLLPAEPEEADPFLFNGWSDSELPAGREEVVTARLAPEVVAAARARMKVPTADGFQPVSLSSHAASAATPENPTVRPPTLDLATVAPFTELPDDIRRELAVSAEMNVLGDGKEITGFALALVLSGDVETYAAGAPSRHFSAGAVVSGQMQDAAGGLSLHLRSHAGTASVAIWRTGALDAVLAAHPEVRAKLSAA